MISWKFVDCSLWISCGLLWVSSPSLHTLPWEKFVHFAHHTCLGQSGKYQGRAYSECVKLLYVKQLTVLKMATSWSNMSLMSFIQCTRVWPPWLHLKKRPFSGQPLPQPSLSHGQPVITVTATVWHLPNFMSQPSLLSCQHIPSIAYLLTFSTTRVTATMLWLADIHWTGTSRVIFGTFGIPDECTKDGGPPEFTAAATCQFLKDCCLKLQSRNWRRNCQMTHHQQQRPTWPSKYWCSITF